MKTIGQYLTFTLGIAKQADAFLLVRDTGRVFDSHELSKLGEHMEAS